jgi:hypothetical protein
LKGEGFPIPITFRKEEALLIEDAGRIADVKGAGMSAPNEKGIA